MSDDVVVFKNGKLELEVTVREDKETVWLSANQMTSHIGRDSKTMRKHINSALKEELNGNDSVVAKFATTASDGKKIYG